MDPVVEFTMQSKTASRGSYVESRSWLLASSRRPTVFGDSMSLQAQIEIMTNPQEFTRLCNVVLIAEHGDDFLPIDDDRADRGNDGFLKSEQRMFAAHCFKRVQNRSLDAPIRAKMIGDLGKALALKAAEVWRVEAWTFLSNYPIPEHLAAEVVEMGRSSGVDVAWRGPDYFAAVLSERPELMSAFPALQANELAEEIRQLRQSLIAEKLPGVTPSDRSASPQTPQELEELLRERPPGWEFLYFAGLLHERREMLASKWRNHELRVPSRNRQSLSAEQVTDYLARRFGRLGNLVEPMSRVFDAQDDAFGAPGEPGNPSLIQHFADWLMDTLEDMLDWQAEIRAVDAPEEFERALELSAQTADRPIQRIREFIDAFITSTEQIGPFLEKSEEEREREPLVIELDLVLEMDQPLMDQALDAIRTAVQLTN